MKQQAEEDALVKQQKCEQANKHLASYQRPRVNVENPDGPFRALSEEERQSEIAKSKEYINKICN